MNTNILLIFCSLGVASSELDVEYREELKACSDIAGLLEKYTKVLHVFNDAELAIGNVRPGHLTLAFQTRSITQGM